MSTLKLDTLEPQAVFTAFQELSAIPRASHNEAAVIDWLKEVAARNGHPCRQDAAGNLLVMTPATPGMENLPGVIIQGHVDMVCEQEPGLNFDFDTQGLDLYIDGNVLRARGTTLGADNGIAVAMMVALARGAVAHGPVDLLFTVAEETGLFGALGLDPALLRYDLLLNIDSEEEEILYIGCAGGIETEGSLPVNRQPAPAGHQTWQIDVSGLLGGHSGTDINAFRANALVLLGRILHEEVGHQRACIREITGGQKHNVIPREATAIISLPADLAAGLPERLQNWQAVLSAEWGDWEPGLKLACTAAAPGADVLDSASSQRIVAFLRAVAHGVLAMSRQIPGLVATSTNLAAFHLKTSGPAVVLTSQRSDNEAGNQDAVGKIVAAIELAGGSHRCLNAYPGWTPDAASPLLALARDVYRTVHGREAVISSIHAGLETGVIGSRKAGLRMISFGPDIRGAHSPNERLDIPSTARTWHFLSTLLAEVRRIDA